MLYRKNEEPVAIRSVTTRKISRVIEGKEKYSDIVKNIEHDFELQTVKGKGCNRLDSELRNRIIQEINTDLGTPVASGQTVFFKPDGVTLLGDVDIRCVQLNSQSTILLKHSVNVLEKELIELRRDIDHLRSSIASPIMCMQLIERKRSDLWRDYAAMFRKAHPDSVAKSTVSQK